MMFWSVVLSIFFFIAPLIAELLVGFLRGRFGCTGGTYLLGIVFILGVAFGSVWWMLHNWNMGASAGSAFALLLLFIWGGTGSLVVAYMRSITLPVNPDAPQFSLF